jgi:hypothetical protein
MATKPQIAHLELRPKLIWRLGMPLLAVVVAIVPPTTSARAFVPSVGLLAVSVLAWRERVIVVDDVVYHRVWRWHRPLLLDHLTEATIDFESSKDAHRELRLKDSAGSVEWLSLRWFDNWQPLVTTAARAVLADATKSDPKERRRLRRSLPQLEVADPLSEHEAAGDGDRFAGDERGA